MSTIVAILLITLGLLGAQDALGQKVQILKKPLAMLSSYAELIGFIGLLFGGMWFVVVILQITGLMHISGHNHFFFLSAALVMSLLILVLGLIFGLEVARKIIGEPPSKRILKITEWREQLLPYQTNLGLAGIALGVIRLFA